MIASILARGPSIIEVVANMRLHYHIGGQPIAIMLATLVGKGPVGRIFAKILANATRL
jgi:hypothetical protein